MERIRIAAARCIKGRMQPPCRACEAVCPAGAFSWGLLDASACIDCGLCTAVCPAGAVETQLAYGERLAEAFAQPRVLLACEKTAQRADRDAAWDETAAAGEAAARTEGAAPLPCLGFLTRGLLWAIASQKEARLIVGACRSCIPAVYRHLLAEAEAANEALLAAGRPPIAVLDEAPAAGKVSRRDFFLHFVQAAKERLGQGGEAATGEAREGDGAAVIGTAASSSSYETAAAAQKKEAEMLSPPVSLFTPVWAFSRGALPAAVHGDLTLFDGCTGCGFCARLCPSGALRAELQEAELVLTFYPQLCTSCGLCQARCPKGALRLTASPAAKRWRVPLPHCASCGAPFQPIGASDVCRACLDGARTAAAPSSPHED